MLSVVCRKPGELALEERPLPERSRDEVLIAIRRIGICGTDYHIFEGLHPFLQYPRIMGHELSAEVLDAPKGASTPLATRWLSFRTSRVGCASPAARVHQCD